MAERIPTPSEVARIPDIVHALKQRLESMCGPRLVKLCLFGSRARGDHSEDSDIDVAAVIRGLDRREKMAVLDAVALLSPPARLPGVSRGYSPSGASSPIDWTRPSG